MKFDQSRYAFAMAISGLSSMCISSLEAKFDVYRSWGWSEDELGSAFRKAPYCIKLSKENIMSKMNYFVNKMSYAPSYIAEQPSVLSYSLEKRIIPRCFVMQVLIAKGLVKEPPTLCTFLTLAGDKFLEKYITPFKKEVPELMNAYQGKGKMNGLDHCSSAL
ncbi:hypothetical protein ACHQM5_019570 [Ranunculus cassubicifolius]